MWASKKIKLKTFRIAYRILNLHYYVRNQICSMNANSIFPWKLHASLKIASKFRGTSSVSFQLNLIWISMRLKLSPTQFYPIRLSGYPMAWWQLIFLSLTFFLLRLCSKTINNGAVQLIRQLASQLAKLPPISFA